MKVSVTRTGGIAGLTRTWSVAVDSGQPDSSEWTDLLGRLPWNSRPRGPQQPDRFVYVIRASRRSVTLPEQQVTGAWRELVDRVREADENGA
jgi:hypothetical protein